MPGTPMIPWNIGPVGPIFQGQKLRLRMTMSLLTSIPSVGAQMEFCTRARQADPLNSKLRVTGMDCRVSSSCGFCWLCV